MARYIKSRTKLSRRVGRNLFLKGSRSFSAKDDYTKKPIRNNKKKFVTLSGYGKQLLEKQALKYTYGIQEKQLSNIFKKSFKQNGDTGFLALSTLEKRLDNVIYRAGLANSRAQARQLVNHGQFEVNGVKTDIPSFIVKVGDLITIKNSKAKNGFWQNFKLEVPNDVPTWMDASKQSTVKVLSLPLDSDVPQDINISSIVEYYSRKVS